MKNTLSSLFLVMALLWSCTKDEPVLESISLYSVTVNGIHLNEGMVNIPVDAVFELTFSAALDVNKFESAFSLRSINGTIMPNFSYANAVSKAVVTVSGLEFHTNYTLQLGIVALGQKGEILDRNVAVSFTTAKEGKITEMAPCTTASDLCLQTVEWNSQAKFDFYSNYPIYEDNAGWEKLKYAILVIHGQNRDADAYFSYLTLALSNQQLADRTILIAPYFKSNAEAGPGDLYWRSSNWREGQPSGNAASISSFSVMDRLIERLADKTYFPFLEKVVLVGHSSGALFTQVYAVANSSESLHPDIDFEYIVANSQYFYYPADVRFDENAQVFVSPENCPEFNHWPLGYLNPPAYLNGVPKVDIDRQVMERKVIYLLGNGTSPDGSLNTTDCGAVLLGSTRFKRGENLFRLLETNYKNVHRSRKIIVEGIGHNGEGMFQSTEFRRLISELFN